MKHAALLVIPLFLWLVSRPLSLAPTLEAAAYKCILTNSCTPPPCEFWDALKINLASQNAVFKIQPPRTNSRAAERRMWKDINAELRKTSFRFTPCAPYAVADFVISEAPECEVVLQEGSSLRLASLDDALRATTGCSELTEAAFAAAKEEQDNCRFFSGQSSISLAQQRANAFVEFQAHTESLKQSLLRYLSSCVPDAETEAEIAEVGLDALLQEGAQARQEWEAKRAEVAAGK
jgi:hypothetical protein